jgi:hypothetical protein
MTVNLPRCITFARLLPALFAAFFHAAGGTQRVLLLPSPIMLRVALLSRHSPARGMLLLVAAVFFGSFVGWSFRNRFRNRAINCDPLSNQDVRNTEPPVSCLFAPAWWADVLKGSVCHGDTGCRSFCVVGCHQSPTKICLESGGDVCESKG